MHGTGSRANTGRFVRNTKKITKMTVIETLTFTLAFIAGVAFGAAFFGGLLWTVSHGIRSKKPALLYATSFLVRSTLALIGFYAVGRGHLERLSACLLGFFAIRFFILRLAWPTRSKNMSCKEDLCI